MSKGKPRGWGDATASRDETGAVAVMKRINIIRARVYY